MVNMGKQFHNRLDLQGPTKTESHPTHFHPLQLHPDFPPLNFNLQPFKNIHSRHLKLHALYYPLAPWPPPLHAMTGPVRSTTASKARTKEIQPPRPPNAWILYRSDKLKSLPEQPGQQRRAQADVSKLISEMWRHESEAVKLEYERLADAKKAEHQRLYPSYRFQPMKKEEKVRIKEEKRQEMEQRRQKKEHARAQKKPRIRPNAVAGPSQVPPPIPPIPYAPPYLIPAPIPFPMHMTHPLYTPYSPEVHFGPAGPSPPLSAASSPDDTTSAYDSPSGSDEFLMPPSAVPSTRASPIPDATSQHSQLLPSGMLLPPSFFHSLQQPLQNAYAAQPMPPQQPQAAHPQWQPPQDHILPQPSGSGVTVQPTEWNNLNSSQVSLDFQEPQEYLNLDIPLANNMGGLEGLTFEGLQAMLASTGENGVYSPADLVARPQGELDIAMAPLPDPDALEELGDIFNNFDFGAAFGPVSHELESSAMDPTDPSSFQEFVSLFQAPNNPELEAYTGVQQRQPSLFTREVLQYINFEGAEGGSQNVPAPQVRAPPPPPPSTSTQMPILTQMTNTATVARSGYVPPSGAAHSSTRRVAGSWKSSFAIPEESPIQNPWNVRTV